MITNAATAYVLQVLIYTGKSTYGSTDDQDKLKTVQVVEKLVEPFVGSYRTVYVDRFYTSIDLLKALEEKTLPNWNDVSEPDPTQYSHRKEFGGLPNHEKR